MLTEPHCIGWVKSTVALWGEAPGEPQPVQLTEAKPCRLRYIGDCIISDRGLTLKAFRAGTNVHLRFYFKDHDIYFPSEIVGVSRASACATVHIDPMRGPKC